MLLNVCSQTQVNYVYFFLERMNKYASIVECTEVVVKEVGENIEDICIKEMVDTELIVKKEVEDFVKEEVEIIVKKETQNIVKEEAEDLEIEMKDVKERNYEKGKEILNVF